jgi:hypothetical protein
MMSACEICVFDFNRFVVIFDLRHPISQCRQQLHREGAGPDGGWTPSGCCNQPECAHLPAACQRRSTKSQSTVSVCRNLLSNQALLVRWDPFLVLDLGLDILDSVGTFDLERDGFAGQCLHKDLHPAAQTKNQMEGGLLLNVVISQSAPIFQLLTSEDLKKEVMVPLPKVEGCFTKRC